MSKQTELKELQRQLYELDTKRHKIIRKIAELGGQPAKQRVQSPVAVTVLQLLHEAGPLGLTAPEVVEEVQNDIPAASPITIKTHLCRMAKRGEIRTTGHPGQYRYSSARASRRP